MRSGRRRESAPGRGDAFPPDRRNAVGLTMRRSASHRCVDPLDIRESRDDCSAIGPQAPERIGSACLPLLADFSRGRDDLFKEAP